MNSAQTQLHLHRSGRRKDVLLLCDHAGNQIPTELDELGLDRSQRRRHIAWDPGALQVAEALAVQLDAELIAWPISRLVADPNRAPDHADLILARSDDIFVPGNETLTDDEREQRLREYHEPYHAAIAAAVERLVQEGNSPVVVSIHSFEPVWVGIPRPWSAGVLWKHDRAGLDGVFKSLQSDGTAIGDNQPYDGRVALGYTLERHAIQRGLRHVLFEIRNDLLVDPDAAVVWANRLAMALRQGGLLGTN